MKLDKFDREILRVLQRDATVSMANLSQQVGLSHTPCWRRVKKLEAENIILQKDLTFIIICDYFFKREIKTGIADWE